MPPAPIRILHLSDFHFSDKKAWDADPVMNQLAATIGRELVTDRKLPGAAIGFTPSPCAPPRGA